MHRSKLSLWVGILLLVLAGGLWVTRTKNHGEYLQSHCVMGEVGQTLAPQAYDSYRAYVTRRVSLAGDITHRRSVIQNMIAASPRHDAIDQWRATLDVVDRLIADVTAQPDPDFNSCIDWVRELRLFSRRAEGVLEALDEIQGRLSAKINQIRSRAGTKPVALGSPPSR